MKTPNREEREAAGEKAVRDIGRRRLVLERFSIREAERVLEGEGRRRGDILSGAVKLTARGIAGGGDF